MASRVAAWSLLAWLPGHPSRGEAAGAVGSRLGFCLKRCRGLQNCCPKHWPGGGGQRIRRCPEQEPAPLPLAPGWPAQHLVNEGLRRIPTHHRLSLLILPPQPRQRLGHQRGWLGFLPQDWDTHWTFWGRPGSNSSRVRPYPSEPGGVGVGLTPPGHRGSPRPLHPLVLSGPLGILGGLGRRRGGKRGLLCPSWGGRAGCPFAPRQTGSRVREQDQSPHAPPDPAACSGEGTPAPASPGFWGQGGLP